jgi:hypothetical protein
MPTPTPDEDPHVANGYRCRCGGKHAASACPAADYPEEPTVEVPLVSDDDLPGAEGAS